MTGWNIVRSGLVIRVPVCVIVMLTRSFTAWFDIADVQQLLPELTADEGYVVDHNSTIQDHHMLISSPIYMSPQ